MTSTDLISRIQEGFEQHSNMVVAIIDSEKMRIRRKLEALEEKYQVLKIKEIQFKKGKGYSSNWIGIIVKKKIPVATPTNF